MSKTLATIDTRAEIGFDLEQARFGNPYTKEAHDYFQRLQFKNLLSRFDVEADTNAVEDHFQEVTDTGLLERIFEEAKKSAAVGIAVSEDGGNVLPLFAHASGYGRIAVCYGEEQIYSIPCDMDMDMGYLFGKLCEVADAVERFVMFDLKKYLPELPITRREHCFDATVAAYLLNPLKNDYGYEDVAREQLHLLINEKADASMRACYEAYTAYKADRKSTRLNSSH